MGFRFSGEPISRTVEEYQREDDYWHEFKPLPYTVLTVPIFHANAYWWIQNIEYHCLECDWCTRTEILKWGIIN